MRKLAFRLFLVINWALGLALILAYTAKYLSPSLSLISAFAGMAYPYFLVAFILSSTFLLLLRKFKWLLLNLLIILLGWSNLSSWIQFNPSCDKPADFRIMSYNVKLFDLYNWQHNQKSKVKILEFIKEQKPDLVSFQEFYYDNNDFRIDSVKKVLDLPYYYVADSRYLNNKEHFGQAIFSKYPIQSSKLIPFPTTSNMALYCDVEIKKGHTVRVFNMHLESYRFQEDDYELMNDIKHQKIDIDQNDIDKVPGLIQRLETALIKRSYQAEKMASIINASPFPVIVTGDFNDTPNSYAYHQISRYLSDAFIENGWGFSNTYKGSFPSFRIDYILYSNALESVNYQRLKFDASDHFPIYSDFRFQDH